MDSRKQHGRNLFRFIKARTARHLTIAALTACCCSMTWGVAHAQSTSAMIHGQAPAGDTIVAKSTSGFRRHTTVKANGRYILRHLPLGVYSVTLKDGDKTIDMYHRVPLTVSRGVLVNFACPHDKCAAPKSDG